MEKSLALLLVLAIASCGSNWEKNAEYTVSFPCTIAGFIDENSGITVGMFGEIHATDNGGKEWPRITEFNDKYAIDALASGQFIHAGFEGLVGMIADGKTSVRLKTPIPGIAMLVSFLDEQHGCAVNKFNDIRLTVDAGETWQGIQKPPTMGKLLAIDLFSASGICALDSAGDLYCTTDAGASWSKTALPIQKYRINCKALSSHAASMRFADADTGTVAIIAPDGASPAEFVLVCKTSDGAKTIAAEKIPCELNAGTKIFLSPDVRFLTVSNDKKITVFRHQ